MINKIAKIAKIATIGVIATPIIGTISCSESIEKIVILGGKTQITDQGREFIKWFETQDLFKNVKNGAKSAQFITKNGDKTLTELSTTFGTENFPSAFGIQPVTAKTYLDKGAITIFKNPDYNSEGKATNKAAEVANNKLAGPNVNKIIKQLQTTNRGNLLLRNKNGDIIGFPTYSEAMGIIYNKKLFEKAGIKIKVNKNGNAITDINWNNKINGTKSTQLINVNPIKDLTTTTKMNQLLAHIKKVLGNDFTGKGKGLSISGKESWAFTSKVLGITGISASAIKAKLENLGAVLPGETYPEERLTPETAQTKLFASKEQWGIKNLKTLCEYFLGNKNKNSKVETEYYTTNSDMLDAFAAEKILTMPQGTWVEGTLNKTDGLKYGFLPIPVDGAVGKIPLDTTAHWYIADQKNSHNLSEEKAKGRRTQTINFIYAQYLTDKGQQSLEKEMGLNNPYQKNKYLDIDKHPLIIDANKYDHIKWGISFIKPGVGKTGYERNNLTWTTILKEYSDGNKDINEVLNKAMDIWKPKS